MKWCEDCEFWNGQRPNAEGRPQIGSCHKHAPQPRFDDDGSGRSLAVWPITLPHEFCGEHREKAA